MNCGKQIVGAFGVSNRVPFSMDTKISEANPEFWRERISEESMAKDTERNSGSGDIRAKYTGGPYTRSDDNTAEIFGKRCYREDKGAECQQA